MREPSVRRYSGRSVEEWKAARRERLLAAALELFGTEGYPATSVERLCTQAKVSTRHFYHEFQNKEAVLLAVHAQVIELAVRTTGDALRRTADRPVRERITAAVDGYLRTIMTDLRRARISFVEVVGTSPAVEEQRIAFRELLIGSVRDLGDSGGGAGRDQAQGLPVPRAGVLRCGQHRGLRLDAGRSATTRAERAELVARAGGPADHELTGVTTS